GYRRYEWKLDNNNAPSHAAAKRLGFTFEGIFRQDMVTSKGNRDTAWYSMLDHEWPLRKAAFQRWLESSNFDSQGDQKQSLTSIRQALEAG
ncbi:MAG: GNAT family protein, partial [Pseudomonadota bacterium]